MTEETREKIRKVAEMIDTDPIFLWDQYDWADITEGFEEDAITELLCNIEGEMELKFTVNGISLAWTEAEKHHDPVCLHKDGTYKFTSRYTIEYVLDRICKTRYSRKTLEAHKDTKGTAPNDSPSKEIERLKDEIKRMAKAQEEFIIGLLTPLFYNNENDVREFLSRIKNLDDPAITDEVHEFAKKGKISPNSKGRKLWSILSAAKIYSATESNWNTALRMHP